MVARRVPTTPVGAARRRICNQDGERATASGATIALSPVFWDHPWPVAGLESEK